jgi:hypothetical protein
MLAGTIVTAGGCAKGGGEPQLLASSIPSVARLAVGRTKTSILRGSRRDARTLAATAGQGIRPSLLGPSLGGRALAPHPQAGEVAPIDVLLREGDRPLTGNGLCPPDMASVDDLFCVDRYEASLVEVLPSGEEHAWSPFVPIEGHRVRAISEPNVYPQGYISGNQAAEACARSGKRLCKPREWTKACMGSQQATYGYGTKEEPRRCNDYGRSPVAALFAGSHDLSDRGQWNYEKMNDASLNQLDRTLARAGEHPGCTNDYGVYDMVGNLHEWVADPNGTFQGGYYQDTHENGDGCTYKTMAHAAWYHDYSTGYRCCAAVYL